MRVRCGVVIVVVMMIVRMVMMMRIIMGVYTHRHDVQLAVAHA